MRFIGVSYGVHLTHLQSVVTLSRLLISRLVELSVLVIGQKYWYDIVLSNNHLKRNLKSASCSKMYRLPISAFKNILSPLLRCQPSHSLVHLNVATVLLSQHLECISHAQDM